MLNQVDQDYLYLYVLSGFFIDVCCKQKRFHQLQACPGNDVIATYFVCNCESVCCTETRAHQLKIHTLVQVNHNCKRGVGDVIADPEPVSLLADKLRRLSGKQVAGVMTAELTVMSPNI